MGGFGTLRGHSRKKKEFNNNNERSYFSFTLYRYSIVHNERNYSKLDRSGVFFQENLWSISITHQLLSEAWRTCPISVRIPLISLYCTVLYYCTLCCLSGSVFSNWNMYFFLSSIRSSFAISLSRLLSLYCCLNFHLYTLRVRIWFVFSTAPACLHTATAAAAICVLMYMQHFSSLLFLFHFYYSLCCFFIPLCDGLLLQSEKK